MTTNIYNIESLREEQSRAVYIDILRIIACFGVVFNHTAENGFLLFTLQEIGTVRFFIYLVISILCKASVPIFFTFLYSIVNFIVLYIRIF